MSGNDHSSPHELIDSVECYSIIGALTSKRKKTFVKLVHVPAKDLSGKRPSVYGNQISVRSSVRKVSADSVAASTVFCGANLELYECLKFGKRKLMHVFNIAHITDATVQQHSPAKKTKTSQVFKELDICFGETTAVKLIFEDKNDEATSWCSRLKEINTEVNSLFKWKQNPVFTANSAYTAPYGVRLLTEVAGVDQTLNYELKVLLECIIMKTLWNGVDVESETPNSVVMYWPITAIKRFGVHAADNHIFSIEYLECDSDSSEAAACVFRSAFAIVLVGQIEKRVRALGKVDMGNVYSDVETQNRKSVLGTLRSAKSFDETEEEAAGAAPARKPTLPLRPANGVEYSSFSSESDNEFEPLEAESKLNQSTEFIESVSGDAAEPVYHVVDIEAEKKDKNLLIQDEYEELHYQSVDVLTMPGKKHSSPTSPTDVQTAAFNSNNSSRKTSEACASKAEKSPYKDSSHEHTVSHHKQSSNSKKNTNCQVSTAQNERKMSSDKTEGRAEQKLGKGQAKKGSHSGVVSKLVESYQL